jgi:hypothetical protein
MVELLLLILADVSTPSFADFMRRLAGPANLGDKLRDARRDYQCGEIAIRPTWRFRARLACEMVLGYCALAAFVSATRDSWPGEFVRCSPNLSGSGFHGPIRIEGIMGFISSL